MEVLSMLKHSLVSEGTNPITRHFQLSKQTASAGPEMVWKIYDAVRIKDNIPASVFVFERKVADKLHKPRRGERVAEILRREVKQLSRLKHPKILKVLHALEECPDSLAFATEPVMGSLANLLGKHERLPANAPPDYKDYTFLEVEIKYGLLQITESLSYLHNTEQMIHGNICPQSVIITKRGMWKLAGLGFADKPKGCGKEGQWPLQWTTKNPKMAQPDLDFIAPEVQLDIGKVTPSFIADMFSLGILICSLYNQGKSLIQAVHNPATYAKKIEQLSDLFGEVAHKMPLPLVEPVEKMINRDVRYRPSAQHFMLLKYFDDPVARSVHSLDVVDSADLSLKCEFFAKLVQTIPRMPTKILYNTVFPVVRAQIECPEMLVLALPSLVCMVDNASCEEYCTILQPELKRLYAMNRPVQATVYLLEKLEVLLSKASEEEVHGDLLPMIFNTLESNSIQGQEAAISVFSTIKRYLDDQTLRKLVLPKAKSLFTKSTNLRIRLNALACIDKLLESLDKMMILDEVLPFLTDINCQDVDIIMSVIAIYKHMLSDRKYGLTHNLLASKVMPSLIPYTLCPGLSIEQFSDLMEVLREMLHQIDRQRRSKMISETADNRNGSHRRTSIDMRYSVYDPPRQEDVFTGNKYTLTVDEAYYNKCKPPSTPELQTKRSSQESLSPRAYRRHSSFQGLGSEEQAVLEKIVRERRTSLHPDSQGTPKILVSEPSVSDLGEHMFYLMPRRASTQSMGPVVVPFSDISSQEPGRRDSRGRLMDGFPSQAQRRSSFQGVCESAMQFFAGK